MLFEIGKRIERRLLVARPAEHAGEIARLAAQSPRLLPDRGIAQAQQRTPALHRAAEIVNGLGVRSRRVFDCGARLGEDVAGTPAPRPPPRSVAGPVRPASGQYTGGAGGGRKRRRRPFQALSRLLHKLPRVRSRASRFSDDFDAGWSSPVARQAHNLKVVGSNPTPATKINPTDSIGWWGFTKWPLSPKPVLATNWQPLAT